MKNTIIRLSSVALLTLVGSVAHAETKVVTQGRSGFTVVHTDDNASMNQGYRPETRVALMMDKPEQMPKVKTIGRAGYRVIPANNRGR
jgi:hypothetical protein